MSFALAGTTKVLEVLLYLQAGTSRRPASASDAVDDDCCSDEGLPIQLGEVDGSDNDSEAEMSILITPTDENDELVVYVGEELLACLKSEVSATRNSPRSSCRGQHQFRCTLCPFRSFRSENAERLLHHLMKYHVARVQFRP